MQKFIAFVMFLQQAFDSCQDPHMIDQLLQVLTEEQIGKRIQAEKIYSVYIQKVNEHKFCANCCKGMIVSKFRSEQLMLYINVICGHLCKDY